MANADAVRQQLQVWDRLMHVNVKVHAALRALNQFPRGDQAHRLLDSMDAEERDKYMAVRKNTLRMVELLAALEQSLSEKARTADDAEDNEEIESSESEVEDEDQDGPLEAYDEDEEDEQEADEDQQQQKISRTKKMTKSGLKALEKQVKAKDQFYDKSRNAILEKWFERTRLTISKKHKDNFDDLESSAVSQIDKILSDRSRLIRRTQLKRVNQDRIGGPPDQSHDPEIFDDDDFYQTLLKEFIDQKVADTSDPIQISRQWLEVQKLRQKKIKNKVVEKRATKGRKVRYVPIPKLANFHPATPEKVEWSHEKRNDLFKSIFRY